MQRKQCCKCWDLEESRELCDGVKEGREKRWYFYSSYFKGPQKSQLGGYLIVAAASFIHSIISCFTNSKILLMLSAK